MSAFGTGAGARPLARLHAILGTPGLVIGLLSILSFAFGLIALAGGYHQFRDTSRDALHRVLGEWVRVTPVDHLRRTLKDHADRWQQADPAGRVALRPELEARLAELGRALNQPGGSDPLLAIVSMELSADGAPPLALARWPRPGVGAGSAADTHAFRDRFPILAAGPSPSTRPAIALEVRYRVAAVVEGAATDLEASYHRLLLALLGLSGYSLLCLAYMIGHARALRDRVARVSAGQEGGRSKSEYQWMRSARLRSSSRVRSRPKLCTSSAPKEETPTSVTQTGLPVTSAASRTRSGHSVSCQWFQSSGKPCTPTASTCSITPCEAMLRRKSMSQEETPPRTMGRFGFAARMATEACLTMSAKRSQWGSSLKFQWDKLFGSFHNTTASTILGGSSRTVYDTIFSRASPDVGRRRVERHGYKPQQGWIIHISVGK